jgi:hypothetical protein
MRRFMITAAFVLMATVAISGESPDTPETRKLAAEKYIQVTDFAALWDSGLRAGVQGLPEDRREEVIAMAKKHIRIDALQSYMLAAMVKTFTTQELEALAAFYGSSEGKSAMAKFGTYMSDLLPAVQAEMVRAVTEMQAEAAAAKPATSGT